jgi:hypothetical protein
VFADLPLVSLSIPGLVLTPHVPLPGLAIDSSTQLSIKYRFDLPFTDEVNALAQLPKVLRNSDAVSPLPASPPPQPPQTLTRETFAAHWQLLSSRATLASLDGVVATYNLDNQTVIRHLIEPFDWAVGLELSLETYPGSLTIANAAEGSLSPLNLTQEVALRGISGSFSVDDAGQLTQVMDGSEATSFQIEANSMMAWQNAEGWLRDQRGLWRTQTQTGPNLLKTPVRLEENQVAYELTSVLTAIDLFVANGWDYSPAMRMAWAVYLIAQLFALVRFVNSKAKFDPNEKATTP